jgi:hypothetical protein
VGECSSVYLYIYQRQKEKAPSGALVFYRQ